MFAVYRGNSTTTVYFESTQKTRRLIQICESGVTMAMTLWQFEAKIWRDAIEHGLRASKVLSDKLLTFLSHVQQKQQQQ